jgi:cytochrome c oxidase subunit 1
MFIAVPTGVKIFNWLATLWKGDIRFTSPLLFSIGFIAMFIIGGLSGVTHAIVPADYQQSDTYYIVAHFHYVLFGGSIFGLFAGFYYWWPKVFGRMLSEGLGKLHFWLMLIGFNMTFGPFHVLGLQGMPRRIYRYDPAQGWDFWNLVSTVGAFLIALSILVFIANVVRTRRRDRDAVADPWDGRTLEWTIPSPPPAHNFDEVPLVRSVDDFWHRKYAEAHDGRLVPVVAGGSNGDDGEGDEAHRDVRIESGSSRAFDAERPIPHAGAEGGHGEGIHMPSPSYFPILAALGIPIIAYGLLYSTILMVDGILVLLLGLYGWATEPSAE